MLPFLPIDNDAIVSELAVQNHVHHLLRLSALNDDKVGEALQQPGCLDFLQSYLRNRRRFYDVDPATPVVGTMILDEVDKLVLQLLVRAYKTKGNKLGAKPLLDVASMIDLCAVFGPANPTIVRDLLRYVMRASTSLRFELQTALTTTAGVLHKDIPQALAAASTASAVADVLHYTCDVLHSCASVLTCSPHACYALQPPAQVHSGGEPSQQQQAGAGPVGGLWADGSLLFSIARAYTSHVPSLSHKLQDLSPGAALSPLQALHVRVCYHSAVASLHAVLDTCYLTPLATAASTPARGPSAGSSSPADPYSDVRIGKRCDGATVGKAFASIIATLAHGTMGAQQQHSAGTKQLTLQEYGSDLCGVYKLPDVVAATLSISSPSAWGLDEAGKSALLKNLQALSRRRTVQSDGQAPAPVKPEHVSQVLEILPEVSLDAIERALSLAGGDVQAAIERLITLAGAEQEQVEGGIDSASAFPSLASANAGSRKVLRGTWAGGRGGEAPAVPSDLKARTLALVQQQQEEAQRAEDERRKREELGLPPDAKLPKYEAQPIASVQASMARSAAKLAKRAAKGAAAYAAPPGAVIMEASELDHELAALPDAEEGETCTVDMDEVLGGARGQRSSAAGYRKGPVVILRQGIEYEDELDDAYEAADLMEVAGDRRDEGVLGGEEEGEEGDREEQEQRAQRQQGPGRRGQGAGRSTGQQRGSAAVPADPRGSGPARGAAVRPPALPTSSASASAGATSNVLFAENRRIYRFAGNALPGEEGYDDGTGQGGTGADGDAVDYGLDALTASLTNLKAGGSAPGGQEDAAARGRGRGRGRNHGRGAAAGGPPRDHPVVGHGPRAAGGLTEREADRKRENKARTGNHNRKRGADKKMAKAGML